MNLFLPLAEPYRLIHGFFILCGFWMIGKLIWMVIYEIKYYDGAGEDYLNYGKEYVKKKNRKMVK